MLNNFPLSMHSFYETAVVYNAVRVILTVPKSNSVCQMPVNGVVQFDKVDVFDLID